MSDKEIVLPSGRFARLRPVLWRDIVCALSVPPAMSLTILLQRCVKVDGQEWGAEQWLEQELDEILPVTTLLGEIINKATKKGIA